MAQFSKQAHRHVDLENLWVSLLMAKDLPFAPIFTLPEISSTFLGLPKPYETNTLSVCTLGM